MADVLRTVLYRKKRRRYRAASMMCLVKLLPVKNWNRKFPPRDHLNIGRGTQMPLYIGHRMVLAIAPSQLYEYGGRTGEVHT